MSIQTSNTKPISESSTDELMERKKKHLFIVSLIDAEINKRNPKEKSDKTGKNTVSHNITIKRTNINNSTKEDIKNVLKKNNIEFNASLKKDELIDLVRKNNLVRKVEEYTIIKNKA